LDALKICFPKIYNLRFWIVGDGKYTDSLKARTKELSIENHVTFFGRKPFTEMLNLLSQADIAIIPHIKSDHTDSTIPHKLFQYMYFQKPIIVSNCIPIKRILEETSTGQSYFDDDIEDLSSKILELANDRPRMFLFGENGKRWVEKKYNWDLD